MDTTAQNSLPAIAFMIGMGRSGTTLLTNMLNSHAHVVSTPENEFILFAQSHFAGKDFSDEATVNEFLDIFNYNFHTEPSIWVPGEEIRRDIKSGGYKDFADVCKLVYLNCPLAGRKENVALIVDKNPVYSLFANNLHTLFPEAKFLVMVRNYKDNVLSRKKYAYRPTSIFELGVSWNFYYEQIFAQMRAAGIKPHIVRYEDLVTEPEPTLKKICNYLEIDFQPAMLDYKDKAQEMKKHLQEHTSGEKFKKVMEMHGNLGNDVNTARVNAHEKELSAQENAILDFLCYDKAQQFGYAVSGNKPAGNFGWSLKKAWYLFKMRAYLKKQSWYYNSPLAGRLARLKRTGA